MKKKITYKIYLNKLIITNIYEMAIFSPPTQAHEKGG